MTENIVDLPPHVITMLMEAASHADVRGARMRICTGVSHLGTWVKWDCGRGWTPPYYTQTYV